MLRRLPKKRKRKKRERERERVEHAAPTLQSQMVCLLIKKTASEKDIYYKGYVNRCT